MRNRQGSCDHGNGYVGYADPPIVAIEVEKVLYTLFGVIRDEGLTVLPIELTYHK